VSTSEGTFQVDGLYSCQAYWVVATAITCGSRIRSEPTFVDVKDPMVFDPLISLGTNGPCGAWMNDNLPQKLADAQNFVFEALNSACGYSVPCLANISFTCDPTDETKATLM
jgi:hypothetical protein